MSFYSYKNTNTDIVPGLIKGDASRGLCERACIQVHKVFDSCLQQEQLTNVDVTVTSLCALCDDGSGATPVITPPISFESCRSARFLAVLYRYARNAPSPEIFLSFAKSLAKDSIIMSSAS